MEAGKTKERLQECFTRHDIEVLLLNAPDIILSLIPTMHLFPHDAFAT